MTHTHIQSLSLIPIAGDDFPSVTVAPSQGLAIGRADSNDLALRDNTVSSKHAAISSQSDSWLIEDIGSRNGTYLNGSRLDPNQLTPLQHGDHIGIGPWILRVRLGSQDGSTMMTADASQASAESVETIQQSQLGSLAQERLDLLMRCAEIMQESRTEQELAQIVIDAALAGTGFTYGALVRPVDATGTEVEVIGSRAMRPEQPAFDETFVLSRSLVSAASKGNLVRLTDSPEFADAVSIAELKITAAVSVPVRVAGSVQAVLCLDARLSSGTRVDPDAASFCAALAWVAGLGLAYIQRMLLEERQKRFLADVEAAQAAQARIMPPENAEVPPIRYSMRCLPGRGVAGDMFDVIAMDDSTAAFYLGDVSGKGMGAAMVMASTQSQLAAAFEYNRALDNAVSRANRYLATHSSPKEFASLWIARLEADQGTLHFVDAGHGYAVLVGKSGEIERIECDGDIPLGINPGHTFSASSIAISAGDRIILFSDGAVEERHPQTDEEHGWDGVFNALRGSLSTSDDVDRIFKAVHAWAGSASLGDDLTVASVEVMPIGSS